MADDKCPCGLGKATKCPGMCNETSDPKHGSDGLLYASQGMLGSLAPEIQRPERVYTINVDRPDEWPSVVHEIVNKHAEELSATWHLSAGLYEQLRNAIDGGSECMTHEDALEWAKSARSVPSQELLTTWIRRFGYCTPEQAAEMAEFLFQQLKERP